MYEKLFHGKQNKTNKAEAEPEMIYRTKLQFASNIYTEIASRCISVARVCVLKREPAATALHAKGLWL